MRPIHVARIREFGGSTRDDHCAWGEFPAVEGNPPNASTWRFLVHVTAVWLSSHLHALFNIYLKTGFCLVCPLKPSCIPRWPQILNTYLP